MSDQNTFQAIVSHAAKAIAPLKEAVSDPDKFKALFYALGWQINSQPVPSVYTNLGTDVGLVLTALENLPPQPGIPDILDLLDKIKKVYDNIKLVKTSGPAPTGPFTSAAFLNELPERLSEYLAVKYIQNELPKLYSILAAIHVITVKRYDEVLAPDPNPRPAFTRLEFDVNNLKLFIDKPIDHLKTIFDWGLTTFDFNPIMSLMQGFFLSKGVAASVEWDIGETADAFGFTEDNIMPNSRAVLKIPLYSFFLGDQYYEIGFQLFKYVDNLIPGLLLQPIFPTGVSQTLEITHDTKLLFTGTSNAASLFGVDINTDGIEIKYPGALGTALPDLGFGATIQYQPEAPLHLLGNPAGSRIELSGAEFAFTAEHLSDSFEVQLDAALKGFAIVLLGGDGDGFISKLLGSGEKRIEVELGVNWSNTGGLRFRGAGGFEIQLNPHIQLGPIAIENLRLALQAPPSTPAKVKIIAAAGLKLELGPFTAIVQEVGLELALTFADGNAGPFDIKVGFKPPTGLGLTMKSETIKGGGFLSFNKDEGRYVGALELSIKDKISIKAIGILTTKLPGGQPGYSLLLLITAEFQPIQLGFGFTLNGVGGLIALHRRMNTQALRDGVRNGTIDNILFPTDPVENINSIISSLETVFPIAEGRYSFGPMAIIGWGTPTLITVELGLFFEMPNPQELAIIGVIRAILPDKDKAVLNLQIAFAGIIDFGKKFITFDASLFDSSLLGMTLSGDMAFRLKWGDQNTFVLTVGGFHPKFTVPQLNLPTMRRLTMNLCAGDNPRLTLSTYFAVTSNTAQFGAQVDFLWEVNGNLKLYGYLGFDALFYFSPFRFTATIQGGLDVKYKSKAILSLSFVGTLEGPTPWHLQGDVTFKLLGVKKTIDFDTTFGEQKVTTLSDIQVLPLLVAALQDKKNWQATMSSTMPLLVTVRDFASNTGDVVVHPQGTIAVSQKVVPLDLAIDRFGNRRPDPVGFKRFSIGINYAPTVSLTNFLLPKTSLKEFFAPNEFFDLNEDQRLARPSFEPMPSGIQVSNTSNALDSGAYHEIQQDYELIYMDSRYKPIKMAIRENITIAARTAFGGNGSAANSPLGSAQQGKSSVAPPAVKLAENQYVIAQTYNLAAYAIPNNTAGSKTEALALLNTILENNPELEGKLNVIHAFELA